MAEIRHTGIYVEDLCQMKEFYLELLKAGDAVFSVEEGGYIDQILGFQHGRLEIYKIQAANGGMVELLKYVNAPASDSRRDRKIWEKGQAHIAVTVESADDQYRKLRAKGVSFLSEPCVSPDQRAKVCFCRDPEGNFLELVEAL